METVNPATELRSARRVRAQLGNISPVTQWRWENDDNLDFPKPIKISGRNYFRGEEIDAWIERQANTDADCAAT